MDAFHSPVHVRTSDHFFEIFWYCSYKMERLGILARLVWALHGIFCQCRCQECFHRLVSSPSTWHLRRLDYRREAVQSIYFLYPGPTAQNFGIKLCMLGVFFSRTCSHFAEPQWRKSHLVIEFTPSILSSWLHDIPVYPASF